MLSGGKILVNVAIVGCGHWGPNYVRNFNEIPISNVLWCCDTDTQKLENIKQKFPEVDVTTRYDDILEYTRVDAVVIATPVSTHYEIAKACLQAGKHVLVEKPMTTSTEQAEHLADIVEKTQKVLLVGHVFLYNSGIRKMKELITEEDFGQTYYLYATRTNLGPIRSDVNVIWDLAPHDVSIFGYLLDAQPLWVSATGSKVLKNAREDVAFITLGYPEGVIANIHVSWVDPNKVREIVVVGSQKRVVFDDLNSQEMIRIFEKGVSLVEQPDSYGDFLRFAVRDGNIISPKIDASEPLKNQCQHFLGCIQNGCTPLTDVQNGRDVVRVITAIQKSLARKGSPAEV
jgi:predicted dehydrogenase